MKRLSGAQKGRVVPSVPGSGWAASAFSGRTQIRVSPPESVALKARIRPSGEIRGVSIAMTLGGMATSNRVIRSGFGPDISFINRALEQVFETVAVDPARVSIGGFSDGASYAISVGLQNGELFRRVLAWSPGFYVGGLAQGRPQFYVSHGTADTILPIDRCSRIIVPALKKQGYDVTFRQFDGGHEIPPHVAAEGLRWAAAK